MLGAKQTGSWQRQLRPQLRQWWQLWKPTAIAPCPFRPRSCQAKPFTSWAQPGCLCATKRFKSEAKNRQTPQLTMGHSERFAPIFHWTLSLLSPTSPWTVGWALGFGSASCCASRGHKSPAICRNNSHYITKRCANRKGEQTKGISVLSLHPKPLPMYATRFLFPPTPSPRCFQ